MHEDNTFTMETNKMTEKFQYSSHDAFSPELNACTRTATFVATTIPAGYEVAITPCIACSLPNEALSTSGSHNSSVEAASTSMAMDTFVQYYTPRSEVCTVDCLVRCSIFGSSHRSMFKYLTCLVESLSFLFVVASRLLCMRYELHSANKDGQLAQTP